MLSDLTRMSSVCGVFCPQCNLYVHVPALSQALYENRCLLRDLEEHAYHASEARSRRLHDLLRRRRFATLLRALHSWKSHSTEFCLRRQSQADITTFREANSDEVHRLRRVKHENAALLETNAALVEQLHELKEHMKERQAAWDKEKRTLEHRLRNHDKKHRKQQKEKLAEQKRSLEERAALDLHCSTSKFREQLRNTEISLEVVETELKMAVASRDREQLANKLHYQKMSMWILAFQLLEQTAFERIKPQLDKFMTIPMERLINMSERIRFLQAQVLSLLRTMSDERIQEIVQIGFDPNTLLEPDRTMAPIQLIYSCAVHEEHQKVATDQKVSKNKRKKKKRKQKLKSSSKQKMRLMAGCEISFDAKRIIVNEIDMFHHLEDRSVVKTRHGSLKEPVRILVPECWRAPVDRNIDELTDIAASLLTYQLVHE